MLFDLLIGFGIFYFLAWLGGEMQDSRKKEYQKIKFEQEKKEIEYKSLFTSEEWDTKVSLEKYIKYWDNPKSSRYKYVDGYKKELLALVATCESRRK